MSFEGPRKKQSRIETDAPETPPEAESPQSPEQRELSPEETAEMEELLERASKGWMAFVEEVRSTGLDRDDIPEEWNAAFRTYRRMRRHIRAFYTAKRESWRLRNLEQYEESQEQFLKDAEAAGSSIERILTERAEAPDRAAATPKEARDAVLRELYARWGSSETTAAERVRIKEEMKQLMEEHDSEPDGVSEPEPVHGTAVAVLPQPAPEPPPRPFDYEGIHEEPIDAEFEDIAPGDQSQQAGQAARPAAAEEPIVMVNPVLTRIAMGAKSWKDPKLDRFRPFPAAPELGDAPAARSAGPASAKRKNFWKAGGGLASMAAGGLAAWLFAGADDGKKAESVRSPAQEPPAAARSAAEAGITAPGARSASDAPPVQTVPYPEASSAANEQLVRTRPDVAREPSMTKEEEAAWDRKFNEWLREKYPKGYRADDADRVREEMVRAVGYPHSAPGKAVANVAAEKPSAPPRPKTYGIPLSEYRPSTDGK